MMVIFKIFSFMLLLIFGLSDLASDLKVKRYEKYWIDKSTDLIHYIKRYWKLLFYLSLYSILYSSASIISLIILIKIYKYLIYVLTFPWTVWLPCLIILFLSTCLLLACLLSKTFDHIDNKKSKFKKNKNAILNQPIIQYEHGYTHDIISLFFGRVCDLYDELRRNNVKIDIDIQAFYSLIIKFGYIEYIGYAGLAVVYGFSYSVHIITEYMDTYFGNDKRGLLDFITGIIMIANLFLFVGFGIVALVMSLPVVLVFFILYFPFLGALLLTSSIIRLIFFNITSILWLFLFYPALILNKISQMTGQASIFKIGKYIVWATTTTVLLVLEI